MAAKLCAVWLVVLTVLPFTAPFTTCGPAEIAPLGTTHDHSDVAQAGQYVDDDAIVTSERTLAIRRPQLSVVAGGELGGFVAHALCQPPLSSAFRSLDCHQPSATVLRI